MTYSWVNTEGDGARDLVLNIASASGSSQHKRLANAFRDAIRQGRLCADMPIPPYRALAADLGFARATVSAVYSELAAEGWIHTRVGSGSRIAALPPARSRATSRRSSLPPAVHDFSLGQPDSSLFPREAWTRATRRVMTTAPRELFAVGDPQGLPALRTALTHYLGRTRGVVTDPAEIIITTSVSQSLDILGRSVFAHKTIAAESYGLPHHRDMLKRSVRNLTAVDIDTHGIRVDTIGNADGVLVTPTHQFPTGVTLSAQRRSDMLAWATSDRFIIEDDYDGELRYDRDPITAVQPLAPESVIYLGSASKALSPAVRIGWIVAPAAVVAGIVAAKGPRDTSTSTVDQAILADLIESGMYDKHIRRSRNHYRARRDELCSAFEAVGITVPGIAAGLHAHIPHDREKSLIVQGRRHGFALSGLDEFRAPNATRFQRKGLVVGFSSAAPHRFTNSLAALVRLVTGADN